MNRGLSTIALLNWNSLGVRMNQQKIIIKRLIRNLVVFFCET